MAVRSFTPSDLITLPRLSAPELLALSVSLETAARPHASSLPAPVAEALRDLKAARLALRKVRVQRRSQPAPENPQRAREADTVVDRCWASLQAWMAAWLPIDPRFVPRRDELQAMHDALFGEGMGFLTLKFKAEWAESETRLEQIKSAGYDKLIADHGGAPLLAALRAAHAAYGDALGVTTKTASPAEGPSGEESKRAFDEALEALRVYILEASVLGKRKDLSLKQLSTALLQPVASWESSTQPKGDEGAEPDEPTPVG